jgi:hypothetical protein
LRGTKHTLLLFAGVEPEPRTRKHLDKVADQVRGQYSEHVHVYQVAASDAPPDGAMMDEELLLDPDLVLHTSVRPPSVSTSYVRMATLGFAAGQRTSTACRITWDASSSNSNMPVGLAPGSDYALEECFENYDYCLWRGRTFTVSVAKSEAARRVSG